MRGSTLSGLLQRGGYTMRDYYSCTKMSLMHACCQHCLEATILVLYGNRVWTGPLECAVLKGRGEPRGIAVDTSGIVYGIVSQCVVII